MYARWVESVINNRLGRHLLFWICWVAGFTFIKSFGQSLGTYLGWLSYYIITLPIFIAHTYLVAYVLVPYLLNKRLFPLFVISFLLFFYGFSVLELVVSRDLIYPLTSIGTDTVEDYLAPAHVIRSGLGNLYIVLVFLAARTIRNWYIADSRQKELLQDELQLQMKDATNRVQPAMLLYAVDHLASMTSRSSSDVTEAIARTSELLSEVMIYHEQSNKIFSMEIGLVHKLISLVTLFRDEKPDIEIITSGDPEQVRLPPMILFSIMDLIFRKFDGISHLPDIHLEVSGFAHMITMQLLHGHQRRSSETDHQCLELVGQLKSCFPNEVEVSHETHEYGFSVIIRNRELQAVNGVPRLQKAVDTP
ncbi:MAG: hypothetical protein ACWGNV_08220 [Bacteroidales bacterium]